MSEECYLLVKRGLYYAPDRQGYTGVKARAGRYREVEALGLDGVTAIHENEAPDFSPACWEGTKISVLNDRITALEAENERLREKLAAAYIALSGTDIHASDCATSNAPACEPGPCDCKETAETFTRSDNV